METIVALGGRGGKEDYKCRVPSTTTPPRFFSVKRKKKGYFYWLELGNICDKIVFLSAHFRSRDALNKSSATG